MRFRFRRSLRILPGIPLLAAILAVVAARHAHATDEPAAMFYPYSISAPAPDRRGTEQRPLVIEKTAEAIEREAADQNEHTFNERITTWSTVILAVFTFALWAANIWLIRDARRVSDRQAKDTQDAIKEQVRSADAMRDVAEATKANAALMSGMFAKQMRAYKSVDIGVAAYQDANTRFEPMPTLTNNGLTPARNVCFKVMCEILDGSKQTLLEFQPVDNLVMNDVGIAPRQSFTIRQPLSYRVPDEDVAPIMQGHTRRLFAWGKVTYDDVYGGKWVTNFCISYWFAKSGEDYKVFGNFYPKHNDAT